MISLPGPRWTISYRRAGADDIETLTLAADSLMTALKQAQQQLRERVGGPFRMICVNETPAGDAPAGDDGVAVALADLAALRRLGDHY